MRKLLIIIITLLYPCLALAKPSYQVDVIVFAHPQSTDKNSAPDNSSPLIPIAKNAISLKNNGQKKNNAYNLLPATQSELRNEYYLLSRKSHYQVLGHYSWKQAANNQATVALPDTNHNGWHMQGTFHIRQSNYYLFDANLQCSSPSNPQSYFTVSQKQRLKGSVTYYLDHPQIGMLIKIHTV